MPRAASNRVHRPCLGSSMLPIWRASPRMSLASGASGSASTTGEPAAAAASTTWSLLMRHQIGCSITRRACASSMLVFELVRFSRTLTLSGE